MDNNFVPMRGVASEPSITTRMTRTLPRMWKSSQSFNNIENDASNNTITINNNINKRLVVDEKRKLKFDSAVKVILIPTRTEYKAAGLGEVLWWTDKDYSCFKGSALTELRVHLSFENVDPKTALKRLYQPDNMLKDLDNNEKSNKSNRIDVDKTTQNNDNLISNKNESNSTNIKSHNDDSGSGSDTRTGGDYNSDDDGNGTESPSESLTTKSDASSSVDALDDDDDDDLYHHSSHTNNHKHKHHNNSHGSKLHNLQKQQKQHQQQIQLGYEKKQMNNNSSMHTSDNNRNEINGKICVNDTIINNSSSSYRSFSNETTGSETSNNSLNSDHYRRNTGDMNTPVHVFGQKTLTGTATINDNDNNRKITISFR